DPGLRAGTPPACCWYVFSFPPLCTLYYGRSSLAERDLGVGVDAGARIRFGKTDLLAIAVVGQRRVLFVHRGRYLLPPLTPAKSPCGTPPPTAPLGWTDARISR